MYSQMFSGSFGNPSSVEKCNLIYFPNLFIDYVSIYYSNNSVTNVPFDYDALSRLYACFMCKILGHE